MPRSHVAKARRKARATPAKSTNPLFARWNGPHGMPRFERFKPSHFPPAFERAFKEHLAEIDAIAGNAARPTFANTIVALEKGGQLLNRVAEVFFNLAAADTNPQMQEIERRIAPRLAAHHSAIMLNAALFDRVDELYRRRDTLKLDDEQRRLLELQHLWFTRAGARLAPKARKRVAAIKTRLAELSTAFSQNVLKDEQSWRLVLDGERDLAGLPEGLRASAARAAQDAGFAGKHVVTLSRSSVEGFLTFSARRDLREEAFKAWIRRGEGSDGKDNRAIMAETVVLRTELAKLLGYDTYAAYSLADTMAKTPNAVRDLLGAVWPKAVARADEERAALARYARDHGENHEISAWDWRYYAEKVRAERFDLDNAEVRPYFQLDNMIEAAFHCASKLFGLRFKELAEAPRYHPDVRVWEVTDAKGEHVAVFIGDYFARASKQGGAWMSSYRAQHKLGGNVRPIIVNVLNFARGAQGEPTLLSFDDARTLFHEFGHGLHGMLSDVTFPSISGTSVVRDFVELPSQLYEHWVMQPEILARFARHAVTGKPMPQRLIERIKAARNFNQGFATVEYAACALLDMDLHALEDASRLDVSRFEEEALSRIGMPREIAMRHRLPHFLHIMGGYAAGYYSYLWSEVMDADAFSAFEEAGHIFHAPTARKLKEFIYSGGNRRDPLEAYIAFRGRPPRIDGLMAKRGFA